MWRLLLIYEGDDDEDDNDGKDRDGRRGLPTAAMIAAATAARTARGAGGRRRRPNVPLRLLRTGRRPGLRSGLSSGLRSSPSPLVVVVVVVDVVIAALSASSRVLPPLSGLGACCMTLMTPSEKGGGIFLSCMCGLGRFSLHPYNENTGPPTPPKETSSPLS